ncbi:MAG: molybdopterin-dependent oxidoreductase [Acidobacteriia bacterium]|nr:molybdopterin-dependent oxidoreductase [Terriglobia bacterium]
MQAPSRRVFLKMLGGAGLSSFAGRRFHPAGFLWGAPSDDSVSRPMVRYPEKTDLILLTSRPPQLETPMKYFDRAITPNEAFFVRYHITPIPTRVDADTWRLHIGGHVEHDLRLSMNDLKTQFDKVSVTAVAQCSGNSRSRFSPRVLGGQWGDGAMGCAEWSGARLRDVLQKAGVKEGALQVTFNGLDTPAFSSVPDLIKSLDVSRILNDPNVLIAYEMNGQPLPLLNGFPARVVVPGWFADYWIKNLEEILVLDHPDENFWTKTAYRIPDTPCGCVEPGTTPQHTVPISRLKVRSFIAFPENHARLPRGNRVLLKGIAFDGGFGIEDVQLSLDRGMNWRRAKLGVDRGPFSFREWSFAWSPEVAGEYRILVRAFNRLGESQSEIPRWNPSGYQRNVVEHIEVVVV